MKLGVPGRTMTEPCTEQQRICYTFLMKGAEWLATIPVTYRSAVLQNHLAK